MALSNVASILSRRTRGGRILCLDLDLEAPGLPAYLPSLTPGAAPRGFIGIVVDVLRSRLSPEEQGARLREALTAPEAGYVYPVAGADNLFVLPAGVMSPRDRNVALDWLRRVLEPVRNAEHAERTNARGSVRELELLRTVLREEYLYSLIDSRTGLADEAFATTVILADALLLLFRPNLTQLLGVQSVMTRFLAERESPAGDRTPPPVIPVLSPRPPHSDARVAQFRNTAREEVFRPVVLREQAGAEWGEIVELPYDASLEIGERLLVPVGREGVVDPDAPLARAYERLATRVRDLNLSNDLNALETEERKLLSRGKRSESFALLAHNLRRNPKHIATWSRMGQYLDLLREDGAARGEMETLCEQVIGSGASDIPAAFAHLWISEVKEAVSLPDTVAGLRRAGEIAGRMAREADGMSRADRLALAALVDTVLTRATRFVRAHPEDAEALELPDAFQAAEARVLLRLNLPVKREKVVEALRRLSVTYSFAPERLERHTRLLQDLVAITPEGPSRWTYLRTLGQVQMQRCAVREALTALRAAGQSQPESISATLFANLAMMFMEPDAALEVARQHPIPRERDRLLERARIRLGVADPEGAAPATPVSRDMRVYGRILAGDLTGALDLITETPAGRSPDEQVAQELVMVASWLADVDQLTGLQSVLRRKDLEYRGIEVGEMLSARLAATVAADTEGVTRIAREKLARGDSMRPLERVCWVLLSCFDPDDRDAEAALRDELSAEPLLVLWLRRDEDARLLRVVAERMLRSDTQQAKAGAAFLHAARMIDRMEVSPIAELSSVPPGAADPDEEASVHSVAEAWRQELATALETERVRELLGKSFDLHAVMAPGH